MATFEQIKEFRLTIYDPAGVRDILTITTKSNLPAEPKKNTVYYAQDTGYYWKTLLESGASESDYFQPDLRLSDSKISSWIDKYGADESLTYGLNAIIRMLGDEVRIVRNGAGADSTEFTDLMTLYTYYKKIRDDLIDEIDDEEGINTGSMIQTKTPEIAGGEI